jgi:hypothetical protein
MGPAKLPSQWDPQNLLVDGYQRLFCNKAARIWSYTSTSPPTFLAFIRTTLPSPRHDSWLPVPTNQNEASPDLVSHHHHQLSATGLCDLFRVGISRFKFPLSNIQSLFCLRCSRWGQEWGRCPGDPCRRQTFIQDPQHWPPGNIMLWNTRWSCIRHKPDIPRLPAFEATSLRLLSQPVRSPPFLIHLKAITTGCHIRNI